VYTPANGVYFNGQTSLPYLGATAIAEAPRTPCRNFLATLIMERWGSRPVPPGKHAYAFYAQDSWKVLQAHVDYERWDCQSYLQETWPCPVGLNAIRVTGTSKGPIFAKTTPTFIRMHRGRDWPGVSVHVQNRAAYRLRNLVRATGTGDVESAHGFIQSLWSQSYIR
jgi:hypothetical protein